MSGFQDLNIKHFIDTYRLDTFIETGCYRGDGLAHAYNNGLRRLYSCDISLDLCNISKGRVPSSNIFCCTSKQFLEETLDLIHGNCLIWLDAHLGYHLYGSEDDSTEMNFPLLDELKILSKKYNVEKDVIIVDDIRIIESSDNSLFQHNLEEKYKMKGTSIKEMVDLFPNHNHQLINFQEGLIILTPK